MRMLVTVVLVIAASGITFAGLAFLPQWAQAGFAGLALVAAVVLRLFTARRR